MRLSSSLFVTMDRGAHGLSECPHGLTFLVVFLMESLMVTAANLEPIYWNSFNSSSFQKNLITVNSTSVLKMTGKSVL
ncbi:ephrin-B2 [Tachysurus ichikawai]